MMKRMSPAHTYSLTNGAFPKSCDLDVHFEQDDPLHAYMLSELQKHLRYVEVTTENSGIQDYHGCGWLGKPSSITFVYKQDKYEPRHQITFDCDVGKCDRWTAPLHINKVCYDRHDVAFIMVEDSESGTVSHPHVVVKEGAYVKTVGLSEKLTAGIQQLFTDYELNLLRAKERQSTMDLERNIQLPVPEPSPLPEDADRDTKYAWAIRYQAYYNNATARERMEHELASCQQVLASIAGNAGNMAPDWMTEDMTFMEYFLRMCPIHIRIRHILTYIPCLKIRSGK